MTIERCPNCNASMKMHWHSLSGGLVNTFLKFAYAVKTKGVNNIHLQSECGFTKNEYNNFQKLQYFGLVAKYKESDVHIGGRWVITRLGMEFAKNLVAIPVRVKTFRDVLQEKSEEKKLINEFIRSYTPDYWEKEFDFDIAQGKII